jgi:hypothetical protein
VPGLLLKVHKIVWDKSSLPSFLANQDIPADCLVDLNIEKNELSVWYVEDDESNLKRIVTALAACCDFVSVFDYLIFDHVIVTDLGLTIRKTDGDTPDSVANRSWHRDLTELSGRRVFELATTIFHNSKLQRIPEKKIREWLREAVANGNLDSELSPKLKSKLS